MADFQCLRIKPFPLFLVQGTSGLIQQAIKMFVSPFGKRLPTIEERI
jgi:hypothetical protein